MHSIEIKETLPEFNAYDNTYHFAKGIKITYLEYWEWRNKLKYEAEKRDAEIHCQLMIQAYESSKFMDDMLNGYAPSIALSRSARRKHGEIS